MKKKIIPFLLIILSLVALVLSMCLQTMSTVHLHSETGECNHEMEISYGFPAYASRKPNEDNTGMKTELNYLNIIGIFVVLSIPIFSAGYLLGKNKK